MARNDSLFIDLMKALEMESASVAFFCFALFSCACNLFPVFRLLANCALYFCAHSHQNLGQRHAYCPASLWLFSCLKSRVFPMAKGISVVKLLQGQRMRYLSSRRNQRYNRADRPRRPTTHNRNISETVFEFLYLSKWEYTKIFIKLGIIS